MPGPSEMAAGWPDAFPRPSVTRSCKLDAVISSVQQSRKRPGKASNNEQSLRWNDCCAMFVTIVTHSHIRISEHSCLKTMTMLQLSTNTLGVLKHFWNSPRCLSHTSYVLRLLLVEAAITPLLGARMIPFCSATCSQLEALCIRMFRQVGSCFLVLDCPGNPMFPGRRQALFYRTQFL